jgi:glycosyltransferase involved in cell wall biosynthesis
MTVETSPRLLFFVSCHGTGITSLMTEQALAMTPVFGTDLICISGEGEQFPGLFDRLRAKGVTCFVIPGLDVHMGMAALRDRLSEIISEFEPDLIHVQTNWQLLLVAGCRRKCKKRFRVVYTIHGFRNNHPVKSVIARLVIGMMLSWLADSVIVASSYVYRKFWFLFGKRRRLFLGVDRSYFVDYVAPDIHAPRIRFMFAGQFRDGKNQDVVIRAVSRYVEQSGRRDVELFLPGEGPRLAACQELVAKLGLDDLVRLPGHIGRERMLWEYLSSHCALVPTNSETFGSCFAEPFVLGRVVISRPVGVAPDVIEQGVNGFLYKSENDLIDLFNILLQDRSRILQVGRQAYRQRGLFDWDQIVRQYVDKVVLDSTDA